MMDLKFIINTITGLEYKYNDSHMRGGDIMEPKGRIFKDVVCLDFRSFYPSIIVSYDIFGPEMSEFLIRMFERKQQGDTEAKLAMNSIYGYMKHFDINKAAKVTEIGREWIQGLRDFCKRRNWDVIYSHTDCVMISDVNYKDKLNNLCKAYVRHLIGNKYAKSNPIIGIEIENQFKYIYFKPNQEGFCKTGYIGVKHDDSWHVSGNYKPSFDEIKCIDLVKKKLSEGKIHCEQEELMDYIDKYNKETEKFINPYIFNILEVNQEVITL